VKIAFLHHRGYFSSLLFRHIRAALASHEIVEWVEGSEAPALDFEVLIALGAVGRPVLDTQPKLALIQTASDGYEAVDVECASELGIWVSYAPAGATGNATSVAEFAILLLLGAARHLGEALAGLHGHPVKQRQLDLALSGKTVCIVGLGGIGREIVDRLRPFGVKIVATDEHPEHAPNDVRAYAADQLKTAVADADFIVICVRASKENENLINAEILAATKHRAIVINIARGMLIDEPALVAAVEQGQISAAGLDVLTVEPANAGNPLLHLPQVLVTPHIAGLTDIMLAGTAKYIAEVMEGFSAGKKPGSMLNSPPSPRHRLEG